MVESPHVIFGADAADTARVVACMAWEGKKAPHFGRRAQIDLSDLPGFFQSMSGREVIGHQTLGVSADEGTSFGPRPVHISGAGERNGATSLDIHIVRGDPHDLASTLTKAPVDEKLLARFLSIAVVADARTVAQGLGPTPGEHGIGRLLTMLMGLRSEILGRRIRLRLVLVLSGIEAYLMHMAPQPISSDFDEPADESDRPSNMLVKSLLQEIVTLSGLAERQPIVARDADPLAIYPIGVTGFLKQTGELNAFPAQKDANGAFQLKYCDNRYLHERDFHEHERLYPAPDDTRWAPLFATDVADAIFMGKPGVNGWRLADLAEPLVGPPARSRNF